jgi:hypothetical protein
MAGLARCYPGWACGGFISLNTLPRPQFLGSGLLRPYFFLHSFFSAFSFLLQSTFSLATAEEVVARPASIERDTIRAETTETKLFMYSPKKSGLRETAQPFDSKAYADLNSALFNGRVKKKLV